MTSASRQRWFGVGLLTLGLLVGGAVGALAGNAAGEETVAPAPTTTTTTTEPPVEVTYPTAPPISIPLPQVERTGEGPDPLLAIGLGGEEVIVRVTEAGTELLPVESPGWVMGLGREAAGYYDGFWVYVAPLDGGQVRRLPVVGRPDNDGSLLSFVTTVDQGFAIARVDLDDPELALTVDPSLPAELRPDANTVIEVSDPDGVVLTDGGNRPVLVDRQGNVLDLPGDGALALAPDAVAVASERGAPVWVSRTSGDIVDGPATIDGCDWPNQFQGGTALWWCTDGYYAEATDWTVQANGALVTLFDAGETLVTVQLGGVFEIFRPADGSQVVLLADDVPVSAVRP